MDSVLDGKLMEAQLASSDDALANLTRELGGSDKGRWGHRTPEPPTHPE